MLSDYGETVNSNDPQSVTEAIKWYFNKCGEEDMPCTPEGLAASLGCVRTTLYKWVDGSVGSKPFEVRHSIKKALNIIGNLTVYDAISGKLNVVLAIFLLTNNHGYEREASNAATTININMAATPQQLEQKYQDVIDADYQEQKQLGE